MIDPFICQTPNGELHVAIDIEINFNASNDDEHRETTTLCGINSFSRGH